MPRLLPFAGNCTLDKIRRDKIPDRDKVTDNLPVVEDLTFDDPTSESFDVFGYSVAVDDDYALICKPFDDTNDSNEGERQTSEHQRPQTDDV